MSREEKDEKTIAEIRAQQRAFIERNQRSIRWAMFSTLAGAGIASFVGRAWWKGALIGLAAGAVAGQVYRIKE